MCHWIVVVVVALVTNCVFGGKPCNDVHELGSPTNVTILPDGRLSLNGNITFVNGIGYSPVPPGRHTFSQTFDKYTKDFKYLWERDIPLIKQAGANVLRLWTWDSQSDHSHFLDFLYRNELYVLVPFGMEPRNYKNLEDPETIRQAVMDFRAFLMTIKDHPAVFGYLIGNELDTPYGGQINALFALVNQFVRVKQALGDNHPLSIPLTAKRFGLYVNKYYGWLNIDFWALQYYGDTYTDWAGKLQQDFYQQVIYNIDVAQQRSNGKRTLKMKPLILTEFGADAVSHNASEIGKQTPETNETRQAEVVCQAQVAMQHWDDCYWNKEPNTHECIQAEDHGGGLLVSRLVGAFVMEWVDEWSKGNVADVRHEKCPNYRADEQTYCAVDLSPNNTKNTLLLYEEWLGINSQSGIEKQRSNKYCIQPRKLYCTLKDSWHNGVTPIPWNLLPIQRQQLASSECGKLANKHKTCTVTAAHSAYVTSGKDGICGNRRSLWLEWFVVEIPPFVLHSIVGLFALIIYYRTKSRAASYNHEDGQEEISEKTHLMGNGDEAATGDYGTTANEDLMSISSPLGTRIKEAVENAFKPFFLADPNGHTSHFFPVAQERYVNLIWDKTVYLNGDMESAVRTVYEQQMEGYQLWLGVEFQFEAEAVEDMLQKMALWSIVAQWACTINHCPEKICEVYQFAEDYLADHLPSLSTPLDKLSPDKRELQHQVIRDLHHGLIEIFRVYYLKIDNEKYTFDDINNDALHRRVKGYGCTAYDAVEAKNTPWYQPAKLDTPREAYSSDQAMPEAFLLWPVQDLSQNKMHPALKYHVVSNPESTCESKLARLYFSVDVDGNFHRPAFIDERVRFSQTGGLWTLCHTYAYIIRLLLWVGMLAWYSQPSFYSSQVCLGNAMEYLAIADSIWMFSAQWMHVRVVGMKWWLLLRIVWYAVWIGANGTLWLFMELPDLQHAIPGFYNNVVKEYLSAAYWNGKFANVLYPFGLNLTTVYLLFEMAIVISWESFLFARPRQPYDIPGRFNLRQHKVRFVRYTYLIVLILWGGGAVGSWQTVTDLADKHQEVFAMWPKMITDLWIVFLLLGAIGAAAGLASLVGHLMGKSIAAAQHKRYDRRPVFEEVSYLVQNSIFWGTWAFLNWFIQKELVIPAVIKVRPTMCLCHGGETELNTQEVEFCKWRIQAVCICSIFFLWLSTLLVTYAVTYAIYLVLLGLFGAVQAKIKRVGNVQTWRDVEDSFEDVMTTSLKFVSQCFDDHFMGYQEASDNRVEHWNSFMKSLYKEHLLTKNEYKRYCMTKMYEASAGLYHAVIPDLSVTPKNGEAERRIVTYMWSLECLAAHAKRTKTAKHPDHVWSTRVLTMPSYTVMVPCVTETVLFAEDELLKTRGDNGKRRISMIEYLANTYWDEWENFVNMLKDIDIDQGWMQDDQHKSQDLLDAFMGMHNKQCHPDVVLMIRIWASMRGQTLLKTVAGLINARKGLAKLARMELYGLGWTEDQIQELVTRKYQILIAHQVFRGNVQLDKDKDTEREEGVRIMWKLFKHFDIVFNDDATFSSHCWRLNKASLNKSAKEQEQLATTPYMTGLGTNPDIAQRLGIAKMRCRILDCMDKAVQALVSQGNGHRLDNRFITDQIQNLERVATEAAQRGGDASWVQPTVGKISQVNTYYLELSNSKKASKTQIEENSRVSITELATVIDSEREWCRIEQYCSFSQLKHNITTKLENATQRVLTRVHNALKNAQKLKSREQQGTTPTPLSNYPESLSSVKSTLQRVQQSVQDTGDELSELKQFLQEQHNRVSQLEEVVQKLPASDAGVGQVSEMDANNLIRLQQEVYSELQTVVLAVITNEGLKVEWEAAADLQRHWRKKLYKKAKKEGLENEHMADRGYIINAMCIRPSGTNANWAQRRKDKKARRAHFNNTKKQPKVRYQKTIIITPKNGKPIQRKLYHLHDNHCFDTKRIQRVGRLRIGEGKPENQMHALQFANNSVIQVNDMNQYFAPEHACKIPFMLYDFFSTPDKETIDAQGWDHEAVIPRARLIGCPEWTYTRSLSLVGELMGAAEWCFVTIIHRVLNWPLRQRLHYGHPDWFDAFWVRTRGGPSKASPIVHTNEDIFAGYELVGRGEQMDYVEFLEFQKGRETAFHGAFTFEAKLAQGAAQQIRSLDVYKLNLRLDVFMRLSMFYGSTAFFITNLIMAISIAYYMLAIVMFAASHVSYHELGLLDAVIAVPWFLQVGFFLALPMFFELVLQKGWLRGLGDFAFTLPAGLFFYVFHLRTKTYFFTLGLLYGKGGYKGTGRGFGLDRQSLTAMYQCYSESHWHSTLVLLLLLILYGGFSTDTFWPYLARCVFILIIVLSWWATPIFFNPNATFEDLQVDLREFRWWLAPTLKSLHFKGESSLEAEMFNKLNKEQEARLTKIVQGGDYGANPVLLASDKYWNKQPTGWETWYWRDVVIANWQSEDDFFPGFVAMCLTASQKVYLVLEAFVPWLLITVIYWKFESIHFLALLILAAFFVLFFVDWAFKARHDLLLPVKSLIVIVFIPGYLYLHETPSMQFYNLLWSLLFYFLCLWIIMDFSAGVLNFMCRIYVYGISSIPDPAIPEGKVPDDSGAVLQQRVQQLGEVNSAEAQKLRLLTLRLRIPSVLLLLNKLLPVVTIIPMTFFCFLSVLVSNLLNTMLFSSRVAECWKKAYLRSTPAAAAEQEQSAPQVRIRHARPAGGSSGTDRPMSNASFLSQTQTVMSAAADVLGQSPGTMHGSPLTINASQQRRGMGATLTVSAADQKRRQHHQRKHRSKVPDQPGAASAFFQ